MRHRLAWLACTVAAAVVLVPGCLIDIGDGENAVPAVWDLRTSHRIEDVGWPEDLDSSKYFVDPEPGELTILLPEGVTIEGPFDVVANRPPGDTTGDLLENLVVNFDREPMALAAQRARDLVQRWGLDGTRLAEWAARNADGVDNGPGGARAYTPSHPLGDEGPTIALIARALDGGAAYLTVDVFWNPDRAEFG